jgi:hypothetical protein
MKRFYENSYYLWVVARMIMILLNAIGVFKDIGNYTSLTIGGMAGFYISSLYLVCMSILMFHELNKSDLPFLTRSFTGGLSILFAINWLFFSITGSTIMGVASVIWILSLLIGIWFIVFAFFDIMNIKNEYH